MTKKEILEWFTNNSESLSTSRIMFIMCMGLLVGLIIFITYRIAFRGVNYNAKFNMGNIILLLISSIVMLMISSNIAISLGMVGALSIVRFRTAIKDPHDTVYIFWSIVEGLCVGAQQVELAFISTAFVAIVMLAGSLYSAITQKYLIIVHGKGPVDQAAVRELIEQHYKKTVVKSVNSATGHCEIVIEVRSRLAIVPEITSELEKLENVCGVNWLLEMGEHVG